MIRYSWEQQTDILDFAEIMISASTLLLLPASLEETHTIEVQIYLGNEVISTTLYTEEVQTAMSLYHNPVEDRKQGMNRLLEKLFADIQEQRILPTLADIEQATNSTASPVRL